MKHALWFNVFTFLIKDNESNIFKCILLKFQVSALLGRIPSAVGYQPTLATDMGSMQERITTTKKGSITSVQVWIFHLKKGTKLDKLSLANSGTLIYTY